MRILVIARDYPGSGFNAPSAGEACDALTQYGQDVVVVTRDGQRAAPLPARTVFAAEYPPMLAGFDETAWLLQLNIALFERAAIELDGASFDVVHAFGGAVAHAAVSLRRSFDVPLIVSLTPGRGDPDAQAWLMRDADRIVVASRASAERAAGRAAAAASRVRVVRAGAGYASRLAGVYRDAVHAGLSPVSG